MSPSRSVPADECESAAELDAVLQHHHSLQEKLAEDMLSLARNLKNNTLAAQNIIKQDNQVSHTYTLRSGFLLKRLTLLAQRVMFGFDRQGAVVCCRTSCVLKYYTKTVLRLGLK